MLGQQLETPLLDEIIHFIQESYGSKIQGLKFALQTFTRLMDYTEYREKQWVEDIALKIIQLLDQPRRITKLTEMQLSLLVKSFVFIKRFNQAMTIALEYQEKNKTSSRNYYYLLIVVRASLAANRFRVAINLCKKGLKLGQQQGFLTLMGSAFIEIQQYQLAFRCLKYCIRNNENNLDAYEFMIRLMMKTNNNKRAQRYCKHLISKSEHYPPYVMMMAKIKQSMGRHEEALDIYRNIAQCKIDCRLFYLIAVQLMKIGQYQFASRCGQKCLKLNPKYCRAHILMGNILMQKGRFEQAQTYFKQAVEIDQFNTQIRACWGFALLRMNRVQQARNILQFGYHADPQSARINYVCSLLEKKQKNWSKVIFLCKQAIKIDPELTDATNTLALAYISVGNVTRAQQLLQRLLSEGRANQLTYYNLALAFKEIKDYKQAKIILLECLRLYKMDISVQLLHLAIIQSHYTEALSIIKQIFYAYNKKLNDIPGFNSLNQIQQIVRYCSILWPPESQNYNLTLEYLYASNSSRKAQNQRAANQLQKSISKIGEQGQVQPPKDRQLFSKKTLSSQIQEYNKNKILRLKTKVDQSYTLNDFDKIVRRFNQPQFLSIRKLKSLLSLRMFLQDYCLICSQESLFKLICSILGSSLTRQSLLKLSILLNSTLFKKTANIFLIKLSKILSNQSEEQQLQLTKNFLKDCIDCLNIYLSDQSNLASLQTEKDRNCMINQYRIKIAVMNLFLGDYSGLLTIRKKWKNCYNHSLSWQEFFSIYQKDLKSALYPAKILLSPFAHIDFQSRNSLFEYFYQSFQLREFQMFKDNYYALENNTTKIQLLYKFIFTNPLRSIELRQDFQILTTYIKRNVLSSASKKSLCREYLFFSMQKRYRRMLSQKKKTRSFNSFLENQKALQKGKIKTRKKCKLQKKKRYKVTFLPKDELLTQATFQILPEKWLDLTYSQSQSYPIYYIVRLNSLLGKQSVFEILTTNAENFNNQDQSFIEKKLHLERCRLISIADKVELVTKVYNSFTHCIKNNDIDMLNALLVKIYIGNTLQMLREIRQFEKIILSFFQQLTSSKGQESQQLEEHQLAKWIQNNEENSDSFSGISQGQKTYIKVEESPLKKLVQQRSKQRLKFIISMLMTPQQYLVEKIKAESQAQQKNIQLTDRFFTEVQKYIDKLQQNKQQKVDQNIIASSFLSYSPQSKITQQLLLSSVLQGEDNSYSKNSENYYSATYQLQTKRQVIEVAKNNHNFKQLCFKNFIFLIKYLKTKDKLQFIARHYFEIVTQQGNQKRNVFRAVMEQGQKDFISENPANYRFYLKRLWTQGPKQIICWLKCFICGILQLQTYGIYHADLTFRNTIKVYVNDQKNQGKLKSQYKLIDFDYAFKVSLAEGEPNEKLDCTKQIINFWLQNKENSQELCNYLFPNLQTQSVTYERNWLKDHAAVLEIINGELSPQEKVNKILKMLQIHSLFYHKQQFVSILQVILDRSLYCKFDEQTCYELQKLAQCIHKEDRKENRKGYERFLEKLEELNTDQKEK